MLVGRRKDMDSVSAISEYAKSSARAHGMLGDYIKTRTDESIQAGAQSPPHQSLAQPLSYPKHPFPASFCAKLSSLPNGFSELALSGSLSVQCICIISSLSRKIQRHAQTAMSSAEQTADIQVELDALKHFYAMAKSPMEDYLTNGLISFCNQYPDKTTRNPFFNIALKCFNSALSDREKLVGIWRQDCLVWVAVIIAGVLDICAEPLESRHVVLDSCLADFPKARDWGHLEQILRSFFWTDALGRHWKQCWKAAMRRRQTDTCSTIDPPSSPGNDAPLFPVATPTPNTLLGLQNTGLGRLLHDAHNLTKAFIQAKT
ncbi:hypothetical protein A1O3_05578 [Capronia epimyces CBS 606.96]|uniref:Uncharacterized protein n=1 Tax=Capronia epimyces CBS 606.96 TaxID=1182542 RepID=W9XXG1_9EURO|nr:uncharacterized protein A1O3_05578 [Capronia epimyces CBS 606.96]EXJ84903.1 hypothetical protein A1O3_05578 [Capronia epimyces CBS 606.96]